jgi:hypothetical protein
MWINRLIRRDAMAPTRIEPGAAETECGLREDMRLAREAVDDPLRACEDDAEDRIDEDLRGSNAIFGLIGGALASENGESRRERDEAGNGADDLIETLHEQYRRVLVDPQASLTEGWGAPPAFSAGLYPASHYESSVGAQAPHSGSIEALLSGARFMEDVFGPLAAAHEADLAVPEPVPEILGLFAPQEYLAAAARRARALPPALARREHHTLGLDSPLPASHSLTHEDAR